MPRHTNQKLKILHIYDLLHKKTDENVGVTLGEILAHLESCGINAERKSVYEDIALLTEMYGADIVIERNGRRHEYRLLSRQFETAELRLLVDAVQSSRFITNKKSDSLIKKLRTLAGPSVSKTLAGEVVVSGRIKSMNETIYYNVDDINRAIADNKMISFCYFVWTPQKTKMMRRDGAIYTVSPLALCWSDENYYLLADENGTVKSFRVDKMTKITVTQTARAVCDSFDISDYKTGMFSMWGGQTVAVTFRAKNHLAGAIIDRFGKDTMLVPDGDSFTFTVNISESPQFYGYVCGLGADIEILSPKSVADNFKSALCDILKVYK